MPLDALADKRVDPPFGRRNHAAFCGRAGQILEWIYRRNASEFEQMTDLPMTLRSTLASRFHIFESSIVADAIARQARPVPHTRERGVVEKGMPKRRKSM